MKNILYALLFIVAVVVILVSVLFCVVAVLGTPIILSIAFSWWWILTYGCYAVVIYTVYYIFLNDLHKPYHRRSNYQEPLRTNRKHLLVLHIQNQLHP